MNKIEKALLNSLGDFSNSGKSWKLLTSNSVVKQSLELTDREDKIKSALYDIINSNGRFCGGMSYSVKKINNLFIAWDNGKVLEKISVLPTPKELEKCCKSIFLDVLTNPDCIAYPVICINPDNALMVMGISKNVGVYTVKNEEVKKSSSSAEAADTTEETTENTTEEEKTEETTYSKIASLITSIASLSVDFSTSEKMDIVNNLATLLKVDLNSTALVTVKTEEERKENLNKVKGKIKKSA